MSLPRITSRDDPLTCVKVLDRVEEDPYQSDHSYSLPRLSRRVYGDGSRDLFVGDARVVDFHADLVSPRAPSPSFVCHLVYANGVVTAISACAEEAKWLQESIRGPRQ